MTKLATTDRLHNVYTERRDSTQRNYDTISYLGYQGGKQNSITSALIQWYSINIYKLSMALFIEVMHDYDYAWTITAYSILYYFSIHYFLLLLLYCVARTYSLPIRLVAIFHPFHTWSSNSANTWHAYGIVHAQPNPRLWDVRLCRSRFRFALLVWGLGWIRLIDFFNPFIFRRRHVGLWLGRGRKLRRLLGHPRNFFG